MTTRRLPTARTMVGTALILLGQTFSAWAESAPNALLRPFVRRIEQMRAEEPSPWAQRAEAEIPQAFRPWWSAALAKPLAGKSNPLACDLDGLILSSLYYSARIRFLTDARRIARTSVEEAEASFDWRAFMDSKYVRTSEPVGSLLTTGGAPRYRDSDWTYGGGLRRATELGGQLEASQRIGYEDNNSVFFVPTQQGTGIVKLSYTHPLLRGAGREYNTRMVMLAQINVKSADEEFRKQAQAHLMEIARSYWELYRARAVVLQKRRLLAQAMEIASDLQGRRDVDAMTSQILQAKAAVARRRSEILRTQTTVRNMESRIRALVNDPELTHLTGVELIPREPPDTGHVPTDMRASMLRALAHRPEINEALSDFEAARVKLNVSKNELLPALDLVLETYSEGLEGQSDIGQAVANQFSRGEPSYTIGLSLDLPLRNRAALARYRRQQLEARQIVCQLADSVESVLSEVQVAVREVRTTYAEVAATYQAMVAKEAEVRCLEDRWRNLAGDGSVAAVMLEQLLEAQEELAAEEYAFVSSQVGYDLALTQLEQAEGTLLEIQPLDCQNAAEGSLGGLTVRVGPGQAPTTVDPAVAPRSMRRWESRVIRLLDPSGGEASPPGGDPSAPGPGAAVLSGEIRPVPAAGPAPLGAQSPGAAPDDPALPLIVPLPPAQ